MKQIQLLSPTICKTVFIKILRIFFSVVFLLSISSCDTRSDIEKYLDMKREAANAPITEKFCFEPISVPLNLGRVKY